MVMRGPEAKLEISLPAHSLQSSEPSWPAHDACGSFCAVESLMNWFCSITLSKYQPRLELLLVINTIEHYWAMKTFHKPLLIEDLGIGSTSEFITDSCISSYWIQVDIFPLLRHLWLWHGCFAAVRVWTHTLTYSEIWASTTTEDTCLNSTSSINIASISMIPKYGWKLEQLMKFGSRITPRISINYPASSTGT